MHVRVRDNNGGQREYIIADDFNSSLLTQILHSVIQMVFFFSTFKMSVVVISMADDRNCA